MNCFVFLFTRDGLIYSSLGLSSPGLEKSLSLAINLHHVCFLSAVTDDLPFNSLPPCGGDTSSIRDHFSAAVRRERVLGGWRQWWWWCWWWCVCFCLFEPTGNKERWHQPVVVHLCLPTNELIIYGSEGGEFSGGELSMHTRGQRGGLQRCNTGTHEYHSGQRPCARWRRHVSCPGIPPYAECIKKESSDCSDIKCVWVTAADRLSAGAP